jgi:hypothetical protein
LFSAPGSISVLWHLGKPSCTTNRLGRIPISHQPFHIQACIGYQITGLNSSIQPWLNF